jgi:hypothetical protein
MKRIRSALAVILFSGTLAFSGAESFRVSSLSLVSLDSQNPDAQAVDLQYNDAIGILFPRDVTFLKGLEIEIKIPRDIIVYQNSMAWGLYRQVLPVPSENVIDYQAEQITLKALPSRLSFVLQIPLKKNSNLKSGPYSTVLSSVYDATRGPLLFRLLPIMKGLPDNIETMAFSVKIRPLLTDEGGFRLKLAYPQEPAKPVSVRIDEVLVSDPATMIVLSPGVHHLSIVSDDYRNEVRMFTVESAKVTDLAVLMQATTPRLYLAAPENTHIFLDGEPVGNTREGKEITPGDHTVRFLVGDYELTIQITVEKGHDYTVSMAIDINVTETP